MSAASGKFTPIKKGGIRVKQPSKQEVRSIVADYMTEQYTRGQTAGDPLAQLDRLHGRLVSAAKEYNSGPQHQRQAIAAAMQATSEFLSGQGFREETLAPLGRVADALLSISNQNRPDPLFSEKPRKAKPSRSQYDAMRQGFLAALIDTWIESCPPGSADLTTEQRRAASVISGAYFGDVSATTLANAKSYLRQAEQHAVVRQAYDFMRTALDADGALAGEDNEGLRAALKTRVELLNAQAGAQQP